MKSWITKLRISSALDAGKPLAEALRQRIDGNPELARFAYRAEALVRPLRNMASADPALHEGIMRAVRASAQRAQPRREPMFSWVAASAGVAALGTIYFWMTHPQPGPMELAAPFGGLAQVVRQAIQGVVFP